MRTTVAFCLRLRFAIVGVTLGIVLGLSPPARAAGRQLVIGALAPHLNDPSWVMITNYARHVAKVLDVQLEVLNGEGREDKQLADAQSLISRHVDAIIFVPVSSADARKIIELADQAKIPIVVCDRYPGFPAKNSYAPYLTFIGPDNVAEGRAVADYLFAHGVKNLVAVGGTPGDPNNQARTEGLHQAVAAWTNKGVKLVQYVGAREESEDGGYTVMNNLLAAHPSGTIDGLWCYNDALCLGAYKAIKQSGRSKQIKIGSMDLDAQALALIHDNTNYIYDFGGHWLQLGFAVMLAYDALHGHPPLTQLSQIEDFGIDAAGFAKYETEYLQHDPPIDIKKYMLTFNPSTKTQIPPIGISSTN